MEKYRGRISITLEALKDLLNLPENVDIRFVGQTAEDSIRDCVTIILDSKEQTLCTYKTSEGDAPVLITNLGGHNSAKIQ